MEVGGRKLEVGNKYLRKARQELSRALRLIVIFVGTGSEKGIRRAPAVVLPGP